MISTKELDRAINIAQQLRIELMKNGMEATEELAYTMEILMCKTYDQISSFNSENETGVSDSPATHGDLPLVRKSECEAIESDKLTGEAEHGTLENRIDSESDFICYFDTRGHKKCSAFCEVPDEYCHKITKES